MTLTSPDCEAFYENVEFEIWTPDGWKDFDGIAQYEKKPAVRIITKNGKEIIVSNNHEFRSSSGEYILAEDSLGQSIDTDDGESVVTHVVYVEDTEMYDVVNVRDNHCFYGNGIVNHNTHLMEEFWTSVFPTISRSDVSKIIVASTPNGTGNLFHRLWTDANKKDTADWNGFHAMRIEWNELPGRTEEWKQKQIKILGSFERFLQEFDNTFLDNGDASIDATLFEELKQNCAPAPIVLDNGNYHIWKQPDMSRIYAAGVDISEGVDQDASVIQIIDITDLKEIEQVAVYHSASIAPAEFANRCHEILENWGSPLALVERTGPGGQVADRLYYDFGYTNLVSWGAKQAHKNPQIGMISHTNTKFTAVQNERYYINEIRSVKFNDIHTLNEFKVFQRYPNGTWKAKSGEHDDRVMALIWALMILHKELTEMYFDIVELDDYGKPLKIEAANTNLTAYKNPTSIYTNEIVDGIENSNLAPINFGTNSEQEDDIQLLLLDGWKFLGGNSPYQNPDYNVSIAQMDIMDKWFS